jgi:hypothetical protein
MADNSIAPKIIGVPPGKVKGRARNIVDPVTAEAAHMIVPPHVAVKTGLTAAHLQLLCQPHLHQQFQVAINGAQADLGEPPPHDLVQGDCGRVRHERLEFLQNHLALAAMTLAAARHRTLLN